MSCPVPGRRMRPACRMAGGTGVLTTRRGRRMRRQGNTRRRAATASIAESERPAWQGADCPSQLSSSTGSPTAWRGRGTNVLWRRPPRQPSILQSSLRVVQRSPAANRGETGECLVSTRSLMLCMAASWFLAVCLEAPPGSGHAELRSDASARGRPAPDGPPAVVCDLGQAVLGKTDR